MPSWSPPVDSEPRRFMRSAVELCGPPHGAGMRRRRVPNATAAITELRVPQPVAAAVQLSFSLNGSNYARQWHHSEMGRGREPESQRYIGKFNGVDARHGIRAATRDDDCQR